MIVKKKKKKKKKTCLQHIDPCSSFYLGFSHFNKVFLLAKGAGVFGRELLLLLRSVVLYNSHYLRYHTSKKAPTFQTRESFVR
jgi:hypothetical protein